MIESISVCFKCLETNFVFIVHTCEIMIILTYFFFLDVIIADCCWWCCCCCFICTSYRIIKQCNREQRIAHNCYYRTEKKNTPQRRQRKWNVKRLVYTSIGSLVRTCTFIYIWRTFCIYVYANRAWNGRWARNGAIENEMEREQLENIAYQTHQIQPVNQQLMRFTFNDQDYLSTNQYHNIYLWYIQQLQVLANWFQNRGESY